MMDFGVNNSKIRKNERIISMPYFGIEFSKLSIILSRKDEFKYHQVQDFAK
jgi:hypothetical protein